MWRVVEDDGSASPDPDLRVLTITSMPAVAVLRSSKAFRKCRAGCVFSIVRQIPAAVGRATQRGGDERGGMPGIQ